MVVATFAQAPQKINYQSVVRNANNTLLANQNITARISILQGSATGSPVYVEVQTATTNANGLLSLSIGEGSVVFGNFSAIDWNAGTYFLKAEMDFTGGTNYSHESVQQLLSVPFALYAREAANGFSGNYGDLYNTPTVPTTTSELVNNSGFITSSDIPALVNPDWNATFGPALILNKPTLFSGDYTHLANKPIFSTVALTGNYNDLNDKPNLATVATSGSYNDLLNKPSIPTDVGNLSNDMGYITLSQMPAQVNADWNATSGTAQILNKPAIPTVPTNVSVFNNDAGYVDAANVPPVSDVPTNVSAFTNDAGYLTSVTETDPQYNAWDKDYNDLTNKPAIPTVPTQISAFTNDAGYLTAYTERQILSIRHDTLFLTGGSFVKLPAAFDGNYNSLSNKPNLAPVATSGNYNDLLDKPFVPTLSTNVSAFTNDAGYLTIQDVQQQANIPTNVSAFTNDAGYISSVTETDPQYSAWNKDYNDLINKPEIPTMPTNVSAYTNDAGYLTSTCSDLDICALLNLMNTLQQQVDSMQAYVDSMSMSLDTAVTHSKFHCGMETVTDFDGNVYNTVKIGNQCWLKENLRTTHLHDGTLIALNSERSLDVPHRYLPNGDESTVPTYGYLYNWTAAMNGAASSTLVPSGVQGLCPNGWHVPSIAEWQQLMDYLSTQSEYICGDNSLYVDKSIAATTGWTESSILCAVGNDLTANNATGLSILPAGFYNSSGNYYFGSLTGLWSATENSSSPNPVNAFVRTLNSQRSYLPIGYPGVIKSDGRSVRCLRNTLDVNEEVLDVPRVTTSAMTNIAIDSAIAGGEVVSDGGAPITACGVCWSTSENPTINDNHTVESPGVGAFNSTITGLAEITTYYVRAYATNSVGTFYGDNVKFTTIASSGGVPCPDTPTLTDYDGNTYNTVQIGTQCWMKENLRAEHYADGVEIPLSTMSSTNVSYRYIPGCGADKVNVYGYLYNRAAVMRGAASTIANPSGVQGICPTGWHIPSQTEWTQLSDFLNSHSQYICGNSNTPYIGKSVSATVGWNASTTTCAVGNEPASNNATGFSAVPAGEMWASDNESMTYAMSLGEETYLWSTTEGFCRELSYNANYFINYSGGSAYSAYSVRCLRDVPVMAPPTVTTSSVSNITDSTATCGGTVVDEGDAPVTARGVCWSTSPNPTLSDAHTIDGSGVGTFVSNLTGLADTTTYYVRAYATNIAGTVYGNEITFSTDPCMNYTIPYYCDFSDLSLVECWHHIDNNNDSSKVYVSTSGEYVYFYTYNCADTSDDYLLTPFFQFNGTPVALSYFVSSGGDSYSESYEVLAIGSDTIVLAQLDTVRSGNWIFKGVDLSALNGQYHIAFHCVSEPHQYLLAFSELRIDNVENPIVYTNKASVDFGQVEKDSPAIDDFNVYVLNQTEEVTLTTHAPYALSLDNVTFSTSLTLPVSTEFYTNAKVYVRVSTNVVGTFEDKIEITTSSTYDTIALTSEVYACDVITQFPFEEFFLDNSPTRKCWKIVNANNDDRTFVMHNALGMGSGGGAIYQYHTSNSADDYLISPVFSLSGTLRIAKFYAYGSSYYPERFEVFAFGADTVRLTQPIMQANSGLYYVDLSSLNGEYSIAFHCISDPDQYQFVIYDFGVYDVSLPTVITNPVSDIHSHRAVGGGQVTFNGYTEDVTSGVCWSTSPNPTINDDHTIDGTHTGTFVSRIQYLMDNTTYYVRAYATNARGTAYGEEISFTTPDGYNCGSVLTDYDGNQYHTLQLGNQCWMKENLRTTHFSDGTEIPLGTDTSTTIAYRYWRNDGDLATKGYFYNMMAALNGAASSELNPSEVQGACPTGWHVPSPAEWEQMLQYVRSQSAYVCGGEPNNIAVALASNTGWFVTTDACSPGISQSSNNATGFSAFPIGWWDVAGYYNVGNTARFCTSKYGNTRFSWLSYYIDLSNPTVKNSTLYLSTALSVRCVCDW